MVLSPPAVAQLASKPAQEWIPLLESSNRIAGLKIEETIRKLNLRPDAVVADIGAGSGLFTFPLSRAVSAGGTVFAVDIEQSLVDHIARRARELQATNVHPVLGKFTDPDLPGANIDLAFIYDVLHHIENRPTYLEKLVTYLKPSGRIAIIDFHPGRGPHPTEPSLQVSKGQAAQWMADLGFKPVEEHDIFTDKWFVVYSRQ